MFQLPLPFFSWGLFHLYQSPARDVLVHCNMILPNCFWYLGWCRSWWYSRESPVSKLMTGMARDVTGVEQRASRALGKYCWDAWEGVTMRTCCNWACVRISIGGCEFCVWELVRRVMGYTTGGVSLGHTIGDGAGKCCWIFLLGDVSHSAGSLGTLGFGCRVRGGCFSFLSSIFIERLVWAGVGLRIGTAGYDFSLGAAQLLEALLRAAMAWCWASNWAVGAPVRVSVSVVSPCRMNSSGGY